MSQEHHELSEEPFLLSDLIWKYLREDISPEELAALEKVLQEDAEKKELFTRLTDKAYLQRNLKIYRRLETEKEYAWYKVTEEERRRKRRTITRIVLAAAAIITAVVSLTVLNNNIQQKDSPVADSTIQDSLQQPIHAPANNKAILSLDNGQKIYLDSVGNGLLISKDNINIEKLADGRVAYKQNEGAQSTIYNTLNNPRGSKVIDIILADGSRVWLNNESSIRFPLAFNDQERRVIVTGEAYFEVAKDTRKFLVETGDATTEVLGTHFNVNAYPENKHTVSLLEGAVVVRKNSEQLELKPGQQSRVADNALVLVNDADAVTRAIAWKNGSLIFERTAIREIFKQIERWYDVEMVVDNPLNISSVSGGLPRTLSLQEVLNVLQINSGLKFKIEGKKVFVLP